MKVVPPAQKLLMKNRRVRVWEMTLEPGGVYPFHWHRYPYLSIVLGAARIVMTDRKGQKERLRDHRGDVVWRVPADDHSVRNLGRTRFRNRLVELLA